MPDAAAGRTIEAALRAVRRMAKPGKEITVTHWSSRNGSDPECTVLRETT